jgi:hypothetical protein
VSLWDEAVSLLDASMRIAFPSRAISLSYLPCQSPPRMSDNRNNMIEAYPN